MIIIRMCVFGLRSLFDNIQEVHHEADGKTLLLAKDCLASLPWHNAHMAVTWDKSDLRAWLNGEFLQTAFTAEEQGRILLTDAPLWARIPGIRFSC